MKMKKILLKKSLLQSVLSVNILVVFIVLAGGTFGTAQQKRDLGGGRYEVAKYLGNGNQVITTGKQVKGMWEGPVEIRYEDPDGNWTGTEKVPMEEGLRHGKSVMTYPNKPPEEVCYRRGKKVDPIFCEEEEEEKSAAVNLQDNSAYSILSDKYPWFTFALEAFGFGPDYVQAYLDTLELIFYSQEITEEEFDDHYEAVIEELEQTAYDSIILLNTEYALHLGIDLIYSHEFRLATLHSYMESDGNTFESVQSVYPNYLLMLNAGGITNDDFKAFCEEYDSIMVTYDPIALDDPGLVDSLDQRMYRTLDIISNAEEDSESLSQTLKNAIISDELLEISDLQQVFLSRYGSHSIYTTPAEVADIVLFTFLEKFLDGDLIKAAVYEAFSIHKGIVTLATVITDFSATLSSTSVSLYGNVIEDGGGEVTSRGIAWATFYNPGTGDQILPEGAGTGEFTSTLSGLAEGVTYYARAFAINSAGTAYGNCISFVAGSSTWVEEIENPSQDLAIYPNPASDHITLSFTADNPGGMIFTMFDMSGKLVFQRELGSTVQGENLIQIDISALKNGIYTCQLESENHKRMMQKLSINR